MNQKLEKNRDLLRALLWAYLWLPLLNVVVQIVYFVVMLGVSENYGNTIAQIYNMTLPTFGIVVTQIFNWQLGGLFLVSLLFRYLSFLLLTSFAPIIRFALFRRPIKSSFAVLGIALLSLGIGALLHTLLYAPLLDPRSGALDFAVQIPEYATILFAFFATHSIIRFASSTKGRFIKEDETFVHPQRPQASFAQPRVAPPLKLTFDDAFSDQGGSIGKEDSSGTIISGSAHYGSKNNQEPAVMSPSPSPIGTISAPPMDLWEDPNVMRENKAAGTQGTFPQNPPASPEAIRAQDVFQPGPLDQAAVTQPAQGQPDVLTRQQQTAAGNAAPQQGDTLPPPAAVEQPHFPDPTPELVRTPNIAPRISETPPPSPTASIPAPGQLMETGKSLHDNLASLLADEPHVPAKQANEPSPQDVVSVQPPFQSNAKTLPDDLAALLKEIQVPDAMGSDAAKAPDLSFQPEDLPAPQIPHQTEGDAANIVNLPIQQNSFLSSDEVASADELAALFNELQAENDTKKGDDAAIATLEDILPYTKSISRSEPVREVSEETPAQTETAPAPDERQTDPAETEPNEPASAKEVCLLCDNEKTEQDSIALPDGSFIHRACYDKVLEKMSALKTEDETKAFFQESPNLMKVVFLANTALLQNKTPESAEAAQKKPNPLRVADKSENAEKKEDAIPDTTKKKRTRRQPMK